VTLTKHALDKCEEALRRSEGDRFGYWFLIYPRERAVSGRRRSREAVLENVAAAVWVRNLRATRTCRGSACNAARQNNFKENSFLRPQIYGA
jgi:hypothetical protein